MTDSAARGKQIEALSTMSWFYGCCCIGFFVIGGILMNCISNNGYDTDNTWGKIYIGSFLFGAMSAFFTFMLCSVVKNEKEGKRHEVSKEVGCINLLLYLSVVIFGIGLAFTIVFSTDSGVFKSSCNNTEFNMTDSNTTKHNKDSEPCIDNCRGLTIGHIVFVVLFTLLLLWGCSERSKKNEQLIESTSTAPKVATSSNTVPKDTVQQAPVPPTPTTTTNNWTTDKTIHRTNSHSRLRLSSKEAPGQTKDNQLQLYPTPGRRTDNQLQLYHMDDSTGRERMPGNELYTHSHVPESHPPPLASVCGDSGTLMYRHRLPPILNYRSPGEIPTVPPPSYEEAQAGRY